MKNILEGDYKSLQSLRYTVVFYRFYYGLPVMEARRIGGVESSALC